MKQGIIVDRIWKKFHRGEVHDSLRDLIPAITKRILGYGPKRDELQKGDFWALRDVSFTVEPGKALGIIGGNGAGKSTILKVLNRIIRPNRGQMHIHGRVGALIEIAAGFHADLTGRENIFLQGAVMGMKQKDIRRKFDEIVAFSGIEDFIDTPVKRYSSGMNARLGFSIAAHLDPDIMLIDEVLAVGDYAFQQKAFGRLQEIVSGGIPVVVVSHQLDRIESLCDEALLLDKGMVIRNGPTFECISEYLSSLQNNVEDNTVTDFILDDLELLGEQHITSGDFIQIALPLHKITRDLNGRYSLSLRLRSIESGRILSSTATRMHDLTLPKKSDFKIRYKLQMNVPQGIYAVEGSAWDVLSGAEVLQKKPLMIHVSPGSPFVGSVQLNSIVTVD
ncbi:MAG: ABC transporter ATP-binding protein [Desulfobulbaceae bacterium]|nr:ABC transporter ATP-binding protein [Desulfobulbaceae bacterium]